MMRMRLPAASLDPADDKPVVRSLCGSPSNYHRWREELAIRNLPVVPPPLKKKSTLAGRKFKKEAVFREAPLIKSQHNCKRSLDHDILFHTQPDSRNDQFSRYAT